MVYLLYTLLLFLLLLLYFRIALRFGIVDEPGDRTSHLKPVIRGGAIVLPLGILFWFLWSGFQDPWFFAGLLLISLVSFLDDLSHILRGVRLLTQLGALLLLMVQIGFPPIPWWTVGLLLFFALGVINAFNFMDGINGMMGIFSLAVLLTLWYVNTYAVAFIDPPLLYLAAIAIGVFGYFNFRSHARCFAGDIGPASAAFLLLFLLARLILVTGNLFYLWFLTVFGIDTFLTIVQRIRLGENILKPHRRHLYQLLANERGIPHLYIAAGYTLVQLLVNAVMLWVISRASATATALTGVAIILILSGVYIILKWRILRNSPRD